jgi:hypothetical protein
MINDVANDVVALIFVLIMSTGANLYKELFTNCSFQLSLGNCNIPQVVMVCATEAT